MRDGDYELITLGNEWGDTVEASKRKSKNFATTISEKTAVIRG